MSLQSPLPAGARRTGLRLATLLAAPLAILLVLPAAEARGDALRIVSGGPKSKTARAKVVASIDQASRALSVCWRGERPGAVTIDLAVDARGKVTSSRHKTRGAVAQCAAGVLAVQTLAASGKAYRVSVSLPTSAGGGSNGSGGSGGIDAALASQRSKLESCHKRAAARDYAGGEVSVRFLIRPDGSVIDPAIVTSRLGDTRVERCLLDTLKAARLGSGVTEKTVSYTLRLRIPGKGGHQAGAPSAPVATQDSGAQPLKVGPVPGEVISAVVRKRVKDFSACYDRQARRDRKLAGRVVLRFTIQASGKVTNVKVRETTLNNAKIEACMVRVGKTLHFPAEAGRAPTRVFYPFLFSGR